MRIQSIVSILVAFCAIGPALHGGVGGIQIQAKLTSPISSRTNKKRDRVNAIVVAPSEYAGDTIEGVVQETKSSGDLKKKSVLKFAFQTMVHRGETIPISAELTSVTNSKGQPGVDEEGRAVRKSSSVGKALAGAAVGSAIGAIIGGGKGAVIGAGAGFVVGYVYLSFAVKGPEIAFSPNSTLYLRVSRCQACAPNGFAAAYADFANTRYGFAYPRDWQVYADKETMRSVMAPASGVVRSSDGTVAVGHGLMSGFYAVGPGAAHDLGAATRTFVAALQDKAPTLQQPADSSQITIGDGPAMLTTLVGRSPLQNERELRLLVTEMRPQGLFYFIYIAPESLFKPNQAVIFKILQSIYFAVD